MKTMLFIYNPTSGKGRITGKLDELLNIFARAGFLVTVWPTQEKGDAARVAYELGGTVDQVVCCGGDGTLSETVSGLTRLERPPRLGFIPLGTTNDCATTLRLPREPEKAAQLAAGGGIARPWDVGELNGRSFAYIAAFGAFTEVSYETPQDLKNAFGHLAYIMAGIAALPSIVPYHMKVKYNDKTVEGDFLYGMVCNTVSVGGVKALPTDRVSLDDGLFEVILVRRPTDWAELTESLQALIRQTPPPETGALISFRAARVEFISSQPVPWTLDGERGGAHETAVVENHRHALTVLQGE